MELRSSISRGLSMEGTLEPESERNAESLLGLEGEGGKLPVVSAKSSVSLAYCKASRRTKRRLGRE